MIRRSWQWLDWHKGADIDVVRREGWLAQAGAGFDLTSLHRPQLFADWWDEDVLGISLDWTTHGNDPVWRLTLAVRPGDRASRAILWAQKRWTR